MVHERRSGLLSDSTNSKSALDFIVAKFHECRSSHPGCSSLESQECYLPARLIDVGEGDSESVRLRSSEDLANAISYTCLSHCWGQKRPLTLTATTYSMLQQGISMSALPITYRDAVSVTRVLGVRYIWIDSL